MASGSADVINRLADQANRPLTDYGDPPPVNRSGSRFEGPHHHRHHRISRSESGLLVGLSTLEYFLARLKHLQSHCLAPSSFIIGLSLPTDLTGFGNPLGVYLCNPGNHQSIVPSQCSCGISMLDLKIIPDVSALEPLRTSNLGGAFQWPRASSHSTTAWVNWIR